VDVLAVLHGQDAGAELFGPLVVEAGHGLDEWSFEWGTPLPQPLEAYGAVLVFGGSMHPDQDDLHPWLRDELEWLRELLEGPVATLGICLGSELLAQAAGARVARLAMPEIGWSEVALTETGRADSIMSMLPERFTALQWHSYGHELPPGAVALAENAASLQAFRLGETCWGVQFHPEVTEPQLERWIADESDPPPDREAMREETRRRIGGWNELGRRLCRSFLAAAERLG
jgi:GMP synthase (glutamine-hydrolysing)